MQPILVHKYGGTSVGTVSKIWHVAERTQRFHRAKTPRIAVVVSAMSGETNRLVNLVRETNPAATGSCYDLAVASGEQVSVALVGAALEKVGLKPALFLSYQLGILTDENHSKARIKSIAVEKIFAAWNQGLVPVVAGFQGINDLGGITTLGRGGSDTSAVALAAALGAESCEINTDVDGVYSCDPRIVSNAKHIAKMDFATALEMAALGSKVLHPRCVELAWKYDIPLIVRNTFSPDDHRRTYIMKNAYENLEAPIVSGVTLEKDVVQYQVEAKNLSVPLLGFLFQHLAKENINVDIIVKGISAAKETLGFTVGATDKSATENILKEMQAKDFIDFEHWQNLSKVSIVGVGMHSHSGVASQTFLVLEKAQIKVSMISTSEIKISCVVTQKDGEKACKILHESFI